MSKVIQIITVILLFSFSVHQANDIKKGVTIEFIDTEKYEVQPELLQEIQQIIIDSERGVRELLPNLPESIKVNVTFVDKGFDIWGHPSGINGRADSPGVVFIEVFSGYPSGISTEIKKNLTRLLYHEFHHLVRGWTMIDNNFGAGIFIAAINEGLAVVFSEQYAKGKFIKLAAPDNAKLWIKEIKALPTNANYSKWMNQHSDGRFSIGYRTGMYVIKQAMAKSGKTIFELSNLSPEKIYNLVEE
jgi:hypothetical protein